VIGECIENISSPTVMDEGNSQNPTDRLGSNSAIQTKLYYDRRGEIILNQRVEQDRNAILKSAAALVPNIDTSALLSTLKPMPCCDWVKRQCQHSACV